MKVLDGSVTNCVLYIDFREIENYGPNTYRIKRSKPIKGAPLEPLIPRYRHRFFPFINRSIEQDDLRIRVLLDQFIPNEQARVAGAIIARKDLIPFCPSVLVRMAKVLCPDSFLEEPELDRM